jgi:DNA-binding NtrC family response regulator
MTSPRVSSLRLDALVANAREPAFVIGPDRRIVGVNRALVELTGHAAEQLVGLACHPQSPTRAGDIPGLGGSFCPPPEALAGQPSGAMTLVIQPDGGRIWRRVEFWPFHDAEGVLLGLFGLVRPIDEDHHAANSEADRLRTELLEVRARLHGRHGFDNLIGRGAAHRRLLEQVRTAATADVPILIVGEPGTGKRTVARTIHAIGPNARFPLLPFDCTALSPEVLARQLFGVQDEDDDPPGLEIEGSNLEPASRPSLALPDSAFLVLGDILDLPRDLQAKLAAVDGRVRLVALTTGEPEAALKADRLRPDLYYALTAITLRLLPLRERVEELPLLAQHFLERANRRGGRPHFGFAPEALDSMAAYDWPGNLRELARVIDAAHALGTEDRIAVGDLPADIRGHLGAAFLPPTPPTPDTLDEILTRVERRLIEQSLARSRENKSRAAEILGISRPRLYRRIKELGLPFEPEPHDDSHPTGPAGST